MSIKKEVWGQTSKGATVNLFTLKNKNGMEVSLTDLGATIVGIVVPDRDGNFADVCLGFDNVAGYETNKTHFGAFIGRVGNRIGDAKFELNGKTYELDKNNGKNHLHGGFLQFHNFIYDAEYYEDDGVSSVEFSRVSPDMEQGYPGNLDVTVTYSLTDDNEFMIEYFAVSDQDTLCNMTNHCYFNLAGHDSGDTLSQEVQILADAFTATTDDQIPTGELTPVEGTPLDFRVRKPIGRDINADYLPMKQGNGFDHNFCVGEKKSDIASKVAEMYDPASGRKMEVFTQLPGMQFYAGNKLNISENTKDGAHYKFHDGVCFETQYYPNACNIESFEGFTLKAGEEYDNATIYKFSVE